MNSFEIIDKLGDGAYSVVYKVKRKQDNNIYALKKVKLEGLSEKEKQNALNEVRILASIKSNFVISYKEAFIDEEDSSLCLIMEYADKGDLYQKITQFKKIGCLIEEIDVWRIFIQMTKGLKALHDLKILHRDLKSANIFLFSDGSAKIGDLNVSKVVYKGLGYTQTGTPYYASPEVWKDQPYDSKSDIWSLGCVTFEMMALRPPFRAENMEKLFNKVIKGQYSKLSDRYSQDIKDIIQMMLKVNPQERPSCAQILNHELVKKRLEFFQSQIGIEDENIDSMDEGVLLKTIRLPKNILFLTERLPVANYDKGKGSIKKERNINLNNNNRDKKITFPSNLLPDIKLKFNPNNNKTNNEKLANNLNLNIVNKNNRITGGKNSKNNSTEKKLNNDENIDVKISEHNINNKDTNINNDNSLSHKEKIDEKDNNNLKIIQIDGSDLKEKNNFIIKNNIESLKNRLRPKIDHTQEEEKERLNNASQKRKMNSIEQDIQKIFKKDNTPIFQQINPPQKKRIGYGSSEKKEYEPQYNNSHKRYQIKKKPRIENNDFQKYLKSIGLGDMYKLCMPNQNNNGNNFNNNYNNRYKPGNKYGNNLPNIYSLNAMKKVREDINERNRIIPNKRLMPIGKKLI